MSHRSLLSATVAALVVCFSAPSARSEIAISIVDSEITAAGIIGLDVEITSTNPPEDITEFELVLQLNPISATGASALQFVNPQSESHLFDAMGNADPDPNYVFIGSSDALDIGGTTFTYDSLTQIRVVDLSVDSNFDPVAVAIDTTPRLLTRVEIQHNLNGESAASTAGDQFELSILPESAFFNDLADVNFDDTTTATITVAATAIPEPGAFAAIAFAGMGLVMRRRRR
ncbi:MAG: PEP-CTERM sorting domain-containing protein [Planctomycetota bacterium]